MPYTLEELATDIGQALGDSQPSDVGADLCGYVEKALTDSAFLAANIRPDQTAPREVIYEDQRLGFCICSHVYNDAASSPPHDHGSSWAIYGQAEGETEMTDWRIVKQADGENAALVEPIKTYELRPGMAHFYAVSAVHSPRRDGPTKLIRIEGQNLDHVQRTPIKPLPDGE